jgi:hypothetical protein
VFITVVENLIRAGVPEVAVILYDVIAEPPTDAGGSQWTIVELLPISADTFLGTLGGKRLLEMGSGSVNTLEPVSGL